MVYCRKEDGDDRRADRDGRTSKGLHHDGSEGKTSAAIEDADQDVGCQGQLPDHALSMSTHQAFLLGVLPLTMSTFAAEDIDAVCESTLA